MRMRDGRQGDREGDDHPEFSTEEEEAAAYDAWLRAKVAASLSDARSPIAHREVMARVRAFIEERSGR